MALTLRCWGVRGSAPTPSTATTRYGGNTPCVELEHAGGRLILDAGTGITALGRRLREVGARGPHHVLVTHAHADHVQGLPFFAALDEPGGEVTVHAAASVADSVHAAIHCLAAPPLFPLPITDRTARVRLAAIPDDGAELAGLAVRAIPTLHPGGCVAYRVTAPDGRALVYMPDNELAAAEGECGARRTLLEAIAGAALLVHDATYAPAEAPNHRGWGHSTYAEAVRLAADAGVPRLLLFHHHPDRTDEALDRIAAVARAAGAAARGAPDVLVAAEGMTLTI